MWCMVLFNDDDCNKLEHACLVLAHPFSFYLLSYVVVVIYLFS